MIYAALIILGSLGVGVGALLNALADDLPHYGRPSRPHCHQCGLPYHSSQWVALIAFLRGRSRCAQCQARLQWRRPVVEIVAAVLLIFLYQRFGLTPKFFLLAVFL